MEAQSKDAKNMGEVLHSWKRIASYLNRSVRTARRWEEFENLPVRRHKHITCNTVFAYIAELDDWLHQREQPNPNLSQDAKLTKLEMQPKRTMNRGIWYYFGC